MLPAGSCVFVSLPLCALKRGSVSRDKVIRLLKSVLQRDAQKTLSVVAELAEMSEILTEGDSIHRICEYVANDEYPREVAGEAICMDLSDKSERAAPFIVNMWRALHSYILRPTRRAAQLRS